jgi:hypothetical protein
MSTESRLSRSQFYFRKEKEARRLLERLNQLAKLRYSWRKENLIPLEKPIRRGWIRYYVVRPDVLKSSRGKTIAKLLNYVQNPYVCADKNFTTTRGENGRKLKQPTPIQQNVRDLYQHEWERLPEELQNYFSMVEKTRRWGGPIKVFQFKYPWMYDTLVKPHYVTHAYVLHNEVISEYEYVWDKLYNSDTLAYKYLTGRSYRDDWDRNESKKRKLNSIIEKETREEVNDFNRGRRKWRDDEWSEELGTYW